VQTGQQQFAQEMFLLVQSRWEEDERSRRRRQEEAMRAEEREKEKKKRAEAARAKEEALRRQKEAEEPSLVYEKVDLIGLGHKDGLKHFPQTVCCPSSGRMISMRCL